MGTDSCSLARWKLLYSSLLTTDLFWTPISIWPLPLLSIFLCLLFYSWNFFAHVSGKNLKIPITDCTIDPNNSHCFESHDFVWPYSFLSVYYSQRRIQHKTFCRREIIDILFGQIKPLNDKLRKVDFNLYMSGNKRNMFILMCSWIKYKFAMCISLSFLFFYSLPAIHTMNTVFVNMYRMLFMLWS